MSILDTMRDLLGGDLKRQVNNLNESINGANSMQSLLIERIAELELALDSEGWTSLSSASDSEFSREGLRKIARLSRLYYLKNPIIGRSVNVKKLYVWGNGFKVQATDKAINEVIQAFLDDVKNQSELTSHQARTLKEVDLEVDGNLFFVFFTDAVGKVHIRSIPFDEVQDIIFNPEDRRDPWFYHRVWTTMDAKGRIEQHEQYYPDWNHDASVVTDTNIDPNKVNTTNAVYHMKVGGFSDWKFGLSEVYSSIDWAKAYKKYLENWATIMDALSKFAFQLTTKGGKEGIAAAKSKLNTRLGSSGSYADTNPPPTVGSTFISGEGVTLTPMKTAGATASAEDGRRILLMAIAGIGLPETFYGDASVGSLATAQSLDRPTELLMLDRQQLWKDAFRKIINYVIRQNIMHQGELANYAVVTENGTIAWNDGIDPTIKLDFGPLLTKDIPPLVDAITKAWNTQTLDSKTVAQMLLTALGVEEPDEIISKFYPEESGNVPISTLTEAVSTFISTLKEIMNDTSE